MVGRKSCMLCHFALCALALFGVYSTATAAAAAPAAFGCKANQSLGPWLSCDGQGRLVAKADGSLGAIADYSGAGYDNGHSPLPEVQTAITLKPSGSDDSKAILAALAKVSEMPPDARGLRGKVLLLPGHYTVSETLPLATSGVVLEGSASAGAKMTSIQLSGKAKLLFSLGGAKIAKTTGNKVNVSGTYPSGTKTLTGLKGHPFKAGQSVKLTVVHSEAWLKAMWGGSYPPVRNGEKQSAWGSTFASKVNKTIESTTADSVTFVTPLTDPIVEAKYLTGDKAMLQLLDTSTTVKHVGIAHLQLLGRYFGGNVDPKVQLSMVNLDNVEDAWVDDIAAIDFGSAFVTTGREARRITVQDLAMQRTQVQAGSAKPFDVSLSGTETLLQSLRSSGDKVFYISTQTGAPGPNVAFNCRADGTGTVEPHQRWATGLLLDNVAVPKGGIAYIDRGNGGSGQGWAIGFSTVYNSVAGGRAPKGYQGMNSPPGFTINQPPLSANWGLGLVGPQSKDAAKSPRVVTTQQALPLPSLFAKQRYDRLGEAGLSTLLGPYLLADNSQQKCLTVARATANQPAIMAACKPDMLWELTSRGAVRLLGSELCLDAGNWTLGSGVALKPCDGGDAQRFLLYARDGTAQAMMQKPRGRGRPSCLSPKSKPVLAPCDGNGADFRLLLSTLAVPDA